MLEDAAALFCNWRRQLLPITGAEKCYTFQP